ncbi:hypothetical protein [Demequina litorisediminis]|uniref:hypothetical protein n=1 Tax=Demequina litorisediminis TaxID=1849022 RepID=UPI0024E0CAF4|nr:hypothetical protein [Demequina litorisediminis]
MTATARRERRPFSVVALVTLTFLAGAFDVALGAGLTVVGSGALAAVASNTTTLGVGVGLAVVGLAQARSRRGATSSVHERPCPAHGGGGVAAADGRV